ncbi:MAG: hypothetical protein GXY03_11945 [Solirubrobacterales bacterium]|nr:hypothetical protein [Solirubrobacterales bacterium]
MPNLPVKGIVAAGVAAIALALAVPSSASAAISYYNCVAKPSGQWCDGRANGSFDGLDSWDYNEGWNPGGGSFNVCQQVYRPATGNSLAGSNCGTNFTSYYYGAVSCVCYEAEVKQTSGSAQNINGYADSDF